MTTCLATCKGKGIDHVPLVRDNSPLTVTINHSPLGVEILKLRRKDTSNVACFESQTSRELSEFASPSNRHEKKKALDSGK